MQVDAMRMLNLNEAKCISGGFLFEWENFMLFHAGVNGEDISAYTWNQALREGGFFGVITLGIILAYNHCSVTEAVIAVAVGSAVGASLSMGRIQYAYYLGSSFAQTMQIVQK